MQSGAGRPRRDAERVGDLDEGSSLVVVEHEDRALFDAQAPEGAVELVAVIDRDDVIGARRPVDRQDSNVGRPRPTTPGLGVAGMCTPGGGPVWVTSGSSGTVDPRSWS